MLFSVKLPEGLCGLFIINSRVFSLIKFKILLISECLILIESFKLLEHTTSMGRIILQKWNKMQSCRKNLQRFFLHTLRCQESLLTPTDVGKASGGFSYTLIRRHWTPKKIRNLGDLRKIIKMSTKILRFGSDFDQDFGQFWINWYPSNSPPPIQKHVPK